jgi:putative endonuclease
VQQPTDDLEQIYDSLSPTCHGLLRSVERVTPDTRKRLGALGERLAAEHLIRRGFRILERNYRTRSGELDIVAFDGTVLAFCEVKTRRHRPGWPAALEAIGPAKRRQVRAMARSWLHHRPDHPYADVIRCDAIGVTLDVDGRLASLEHLEGAF